MERHPAGARRWLVRSVPVLLGLILLPAGWIWGVDRIKQSLGIRSVRAPDGDGRSTFWLLPGQMPEGATEEMLSPMETREQEMQALQEESTACLLEFIRKHGGKKVEPGGGAEKA